jgi:hypothetical protein
VFDQPRRVRDHFRCPERRRDESTSISSRTCPESRLSSSIRFRLINTRRDRMTVSVVDLKPSSFWSFSHKVFR